MKGKEVRSQVWFSLWNIDYRLISMFKVTIIKVTKRNNIVGFPYLILSTYVDFWTSKAKYFYKPSIFPMNLSFTQYIYINLHRPFSSSALCKYLTIKCDESSKMKTAGGGSWKEILSPFLFSFFQIYVDGCLVFPRLSHFSRGTL